MKVIDLLNKIAKGEEVPNKIKWADDEWSYSNGPSKNYLTDLEDLFSTIDGSNLNDEIEIIEEKPKKIKEFGYCCVNKNGETRNFVDVEEVLKNRINELTKAVNYLLEKESDK